MRAVSQEERRARLGARHGLADPFSTPLDAARSMVALHSSDPATVYLSCWARVSGFAVPDLETALYEDKQLIRILGMRKTLWVVPTDVAPLVNSSSTVAHADPERRRTESLVESAGIAADGASWIRRVSAATLGALEDRGEATASDLTEGVPELGEKFPYYKKDGTLMGTFGMSTRILFLLAAQGKIVRSRPRGSWISSQYRWALMQDWIGQDLPEVGPAEARAGIISRWLRSFGPGTELDMKWWTGWGLGQVREALAGLDAVAVAVEEGVGYLLPDDDPPPAPAEPWVALLPALDPTTMGWKERDWYLGEYADRLFDRNGNAGPTVWAGGRVVGGWIQRKEGRIVYELFEDLGSETEAEIARQASELETWMGETRVTPRFRTPTERNLTS